MSILDSWRSKIEKYDPYLEHRINAFKGVYIFFMLSAINMIYGISNPYFNYFYLPLTALAAEMAGETIPSKYWLLFHATMGAIVSVFLFNIFVPYPLFFAFFVLFYSLTHYLIALHYIKNIFAPIPIALSLAIYSLTYGEINTDIYIALNNALVSLLAMIIIIVSLSLFPRQYYFRSWKRAYIFLLKQISENLKNIRDNNPIQSIVRGHFLRMVKYTYLLPSSFPLFSILKINLLINDFRVWSSVIDQELIKIEYSEINSLIFNIDNFIHAIENNLSFQAPQPKNKSLAKIIRSWNFICLKI